MRYVLDVSVALCWVIPRPLTATALRLRNEFQKQVHTLIAPSIFPTEAANGLTKSERQKLIPVGQATVLLADILRMPPVLLPCDTILYRATTISSQTRSGLYDCLYIALAEQEGCELLTVDDKLVNNVQQRFAFVRHLKTLP